MAFLIGGANSAADTGYEVANSCRFDKTDNAYHSKELDAPTDADKFTISFWMKLGLVSSTVRTIFNIAVSGGANTFLQLTAADLMVFGRYDSGYQGNLTTNQVFRDPSAWYSIIVVYDSGNATAGNRMRLYVNGTEVTSFGTDTNPTQDLDSSNIDGATIFVGAYGDDDEEFDGYLAEFCLIDGLALTPSSFGEFNEDSPNIWQPIDVSGLTFGNNGFYLDFEDSANLGNDKNGGTDLGETNIAATDQATDSPTNNFCTLNPLSFTEGTLSEGNTEIDQNGSAGRFCAGTIQPSNGKWYFEAKVLNYGSDPRHFVGVGRNEETYTGTAAAATSGIGYSLETQSVYKGNSVVLDLSSADSPATDDIYMIAYDIDNLKIYLGKNGTWLNSGDPAGGSGNVTTLVSGTDYAPITGALNASSNSARNNDWQFNFGNPTFAISSGNADGDGYGNFEYAVPSGFYALNSKNLGAYGG